MTQQHPITPPPELVKQWVDTYFGGKISQSNFHVDLATRAAQWGADQQLLKDAKWLDSNALNEPHLRITPVGESLKEAMRSKPLSLKEQALQTLETEPDEGRELVVFDTEQVSILRRALEQLPDSIVVFPSHC